MRISTQKLKPSSTRWNLVISHTTDRQVRSYLALRGGKKGDLSKFVEQTLRRELIRQGVNAIRETNRDLNEKEAMSLADKAVSWSRQTKARPKK